MESLRSYVKFDTARRDSVLPRSTIQKNGKFDITYQSGGIYRSLDIYFYVAELLDRLELNDEFRKIFICRVQSLFSLVFNSSLNRLRNHARTVWI